MLKQNTLYTDLEGPPEGAIFIGPPKDELSEDDDLFADPLFDQPEDDLDIWIPPWEDKDLRIPPKLIGPDRSTVSHTLNTLESYRKAMYNDPRAIRRDYLDFIDIIGTQARYSDPTAIEDNFERLTDYQVDPDLEKQEFVDVWCTLGA